MIYPGPAKNEPNFKDMGFLPPRLTFPLRALRVFLVKKDDERPK
jgi:hypothetical protein